LKERNSQAFVATYQSVSIMKAKRRLRRFYSQTLLSHEHQRLVLPASEARHLRQILRLREEDACWVIDGTGQEARARIVGFDEEGRAELEIEAMKAGAQEAMPIRVRIFQALLRKNKADFLVEKAQELGVDELWFVESERSVAKIREEEKAKKQNRWHKITVEAAKQSGSSRMTRIGGPLSLEESLNRISREEQTVFFHPCENSVRFGAWIREEPARLVLDRGTGLNFFFGPEGGFSREETETVRRISAEKNLSLIFANLGQVIWKAETAFLGVVSAVRLLAPARGEQGL